MGECLMYGLDLESRCISSVPSEEDHVQFLIGTQNIKMDNQICRLSVEGDYARISSHSFAHPVGEVRALAPSPQDSHIVASCSADYRINHPSFNIFMWKLNDEKRSLDELGRAQASTCLKSFEWEPLTNHGAALSLHNVTMYDINDNLKEVMNYSIDGLAYSLVCSPHNNGNIIGIACDREVFCLDWRTKSDGLRIKEAHSHRALHLDFNPNLQHVVASCGDDGAVRIWDWRKTSSPLLSFNPHAHWVWQVRFHPVHDQLILSAGSDSCVVLSCAESVSSEAEDSADTITSEAEVTKKLEDGQLERIDEHEESVYSCCWATADPWAFASLSYDGRVVVSRVSRKHKYALMQL